MSEKEMLLFTNSSNTTYLINGRGIRRMSTDNFTIEDLNPSTTRVWSLVDSPTKKIAPANSVTRKYPTKIFFIAALSPDEARYHELQKRPVTTWWMSAWADNEILSLYQAVCILFP